MQERRNPLFPSPIPDIRMYQDMKKTKVPILTPTSSGSGGAPCHSFPTLANIHFAKNAYT